MFSKQTGPHEWLESRLRRYQAKEYRQPLRDHSLRVFDRLASIVARHQCPLVLDAGCGRAESTRKLASAFPDCLVIGADKSAARLGAEELQNNLKEEDNYVLIRVELVDLWRLLAETSWLVTAQYLFYPNPWPKPAHLKRRWHAHPVFPVILGLAETLEMRCNWSIYAEEFARACELISGRRPATGYLHLAEPISAFERKYHASGHRLYWCRHRQANNQLVLVNQISG